MRLGLFGGTFNPVHSGHVQVVMGVQCRLRFDHIYLIPSKCPPHKDSKELVSADDRCEMILRSIPDNLPFSLSYIELNRSEPSYSIDTVKYFESRLSFRSKLSFILGLDAFLELHTWKSHRRLTELAEIVVVSRRNTPIDSCQDDLTVIKKYISGELFSDLGYSFCAKNFCWKCKGRKPIRYLKLKSSDISSSLVREVVKLGKNLGDLVPPSVAQYIREKGLYL